MLSSESFILGGSRGREKNVLASPPPQSEKSSNDFDYSS